MTPKQKVRRACAKIKTQFTNSGDSRLMYEVIANAIEDAFMKLSVNRTLSNKSSARRYLRGEMHHAELAGVDSQWIREVLAKCDLDLNQDPDITSLYLDALIVKSRKALRLFENLQKRDKEAAAASQFAVIYDGVKFKVVHNNQKAWAEASEPSNPYRVGVYNYAATDDYIIEDARHAIRLWHGESAETSRAPTVPMGVVEISGHGQHWVQA